MCCPDLYYIEFVQHAAQVYEYLLQQLSSIDGEKKKEEEKEKEKGTVIIHP